MSEFGDLMRSWRQDDNYTQADVAAKLGIGTPYWSKIEAGKEQPSLRLVLAICELFDGDEVAVLPLLGQCGHCGSYPEPGSEALRAETKR